MAAVAWWYVSAFGWKPVGGPNDEFGAQFRFVGCDDWPADLPYGSTVDTEATGSVVVYYVTDPAACGYSVRRPTYKLAGNELELSYELFTPSGELAACICRYRSEFRFPIDPKAAVVTFSSSGG